MSDFKVRHFPTDIILVCVRWYCKYGISYRDLEEMMSERGVMVDHTTLFRWVNTDQNEAYGKAIRALKRAGELGKSVQHGQVKYLNNRLEADHGALKRLINPARGFKTLPTAAATIKGFEVMRMIRKRNASCSNPERREKCAL